MTQADNLFGVDWPSLQARLQFGRRGPNYNLVGSRDSNFNLVGSRNSNYNLVGSPNSNFHLVGSPDIPTPQSAASIQGQKALADLQNERIKNTGLFGVSSDTMAKLYGTTPDLLNARAKSGGFNAGVGPLSFGTRGG
jgi:hypothetical protein